METLGMMTVAKLFAAWGPIGLVVLIWYVDQKVMRKNNSEHTKEIYGVLDQYKADMVEMRRMYESNVSLVKDYQSIAGDFKDVVILNTQTITQLSEEIRQNEFCPMQRVNKKKVIKGVG